MTPETSRVVRVWDPLVRLFHWSLVALMLTAFVSEDWMRLHETVGYAILCLVAIRVVWGFVGPRHARFVDFVRPPGEIKGYLNGLLSGQSRRYLGHNPAGGAMIVVLLLAILLTAGSGALSVSDRFWGIEWLEELHEAAASLMIGLIAIHLAGVLVSSLLHGENLVRAMITGRKRA